MSSDSRYHHSLWHLEHHTLALSVPAPPPLQRDYAGAEGFGGAAAGGVGASAALSLSLGLNGLGDGLPVGGSSSGGGGPIFGLSAGAAEGFGVAAFDEMYPSSAGAAALDPTAHGGGGVSAFNAATISRHPSELLEMQRMRRLQQKWGGGMGVGMGGDGGVSSSLLPGGKWIEHGMPVEIPEEWGAPVPLPPLPPLPPPAPPLHQHHRGAQPFVGGGYSNAAAASALMRGGGGGGAPPPPPPAAVTRRV